MLGSAALTTPNFAKPKLGSTAGMGSQNSSSNSPRANGGVSPPPLNTRASAAAASAGLYSHSGSVSASSSTHTSPSNATSSTAAVAAASARIRPLRLALRFQPLTLALEYRDLKHPTRRTTRLKTFELSTLCAGAHADASGVAGQLAKRYPLYLSDALVSQAQLVRLVRKALSRGGSAQPVSYAAAARSGLSHNSAGNGRLHSLPSSSSSALDASADSILSHSGIEESLEASRDGASASAAVDDDALDALYHPSSSSTHNDDLNRASDEEVARRKAEMNKGFEANAVKPNDPGYVYDKQVEFQPTEDSEWD